MAAGAREPFRDLTLDRTWFYGCIALMVLQKTHSQATRGTRILQSTPFLNKEENEKEEK
jgi:hypothetical protein